MIIVIIILAKERFLQRKQFRKQCNREYQYFKMKCIGLLLDEIGVYFETK